MSSLPFRPFRLPEGLANHRCAAGLFDFQAARGTQQIAIVSFYGQSGNQPAAVAQATDVLAACTASQALSSLQVISTWSPPRLCWGRLWLQVPSVLLMMRLKVHHCRPRARDVGAELILGCVTGRLLLTRLTVLKSTSRITLRLPMKSLLMPLIS